MNLVSLKTFFVLETSDILAGLFCSFLFPRWVFMIERVSETRKEGLCFFSNLGQNLVIWTARFHFFHHSKISVFLWNWNLLKCNCNPTNDHNDKNWPFTKANYIIIIYLRSKGCCKWVSYVELKALFDTQC